MRCFLGSWQGHVQVRMWSFGHSEGCYEPGGDSLRTNASVQDFQIMIIQTCPTVCVALSVRGRTQRKQQGKGTSVNCCWPFSWCNLQQPLKTMNFNLNQQDVFSKMRMKMKIEVNWNSVYITSGEWFGLGAFLMKKGQLAQPAAAFAPACGVKVLWSPFTCQNRHE